MKAKKFAIMTLCAVLLVAVSIIGTVAYLSDEESVVNTFTVGKVHIDLDEAKVDLYGEKQGTDRVKENDYKLIPGHVYVKDPTMTVLDGSEEAYVRLMVTLTAYSELKQAFGENVSLAYFVNINQAWTFVEATENDDDSITYEYRYQDVVDGSDGRLEPLFETLTIPGEVTAEELAKIAGTFDIKVVGHAIQADGFDDADAAWSAF